MRVEARVPGDPPAPPGYELRPPAGLAEVRNSTEDIELFTLLTRVVARGAFPEGGDRLAAGADQLAAPSGARGGRLPARQGRPRMPVAAVKADHHTTTRISTFRGPIQSPIQPPGISKRA